MRRLSLRARLVLGVLALATVGLVAADIATYTSLRSFLFDRTDSSLESAHREAEAELLGTGPSSSDGRGAPQQRGPGSTSLLILATSLSGVDGTLHRLTTIELLVTGAVLIAIAVLGLWAVRLGLRPLDAIGKTAAAIADGDLSHRVERAEERTEVGRLGLALNAMLGQIESAFKAKDASEQKLRRFVADASHELRTPLAAVRAYADLFKRGADRRPDDLERAMAGISRESARMTMLVEDLLLLARLDEGLPLERRRVELADLVGEAVETARTVEPDRSIALDAQPAA